LVKKKVEVAVRGVVAWGRAQDAGVALEEVGLELRGEDVLEQRLNVAERRRDLVARTDRSGGHHHALGRATGLDGTEGAHVGKPTNERESSLQEDHGIARWLGTACSL